MEAPHKGSKTVRVCACVCVLLELHRNLYKTVHTIIKIFHSINMRNYFEISHKTQDTVQYPKFPRGINMMLHTCKISLSAITMGKKQRTQKKQWVVDHKSGNVILLKLLFIYFIFDIFTYIFIIPFIIIIPELVLLTQ